ncbi:MAG: phage head-tail adapter protein [Clostridiales bacterium]|nr:phage head-tail adapter protein [Clostridiales bacterium]
MNKEWAELNRTLQCQLKDVDTFADGVQTVLRLRQELFDVLCQLKVELTREEFNASPFMNTQGYHSKTIAYSIWHIFRIEDIVAHTLISHNEQIFVSGNFDCRINCPIITTGNELDNKQVVEFSQALDLDELYQYATAVKDSTNEILSNLTFADLKRKITNIEKEHLKQLNVVSADEKACWLIDYWCGKDVRGLIQMPLTRHWIMHVEASLRIKNKLLRKTEHI